MSAPGKALKRRDHACVFCITSLGDGRFIGEVLDESGEVLAMGGGDDQEDAILELAEHLMRPQNTED